ncbi:prevent-host-death protein [Pseudomonas monteilii]|nr:prevent-host-death protein [Pseudomonas monteilii]
MHVLTFSQARAELKQTMDDVCRTMSPRRNHATAWRTVVIMSLEDYNGMNETIHLLGSSKTLRALRSSIDQLRDGQALAKELDLNEQEPEAAEQG